MAARRSSSTGEISRPLPAPFQLNSVSIVFVVSSEICSSHFAAEQLRQKTFEVIPYEFNAKEACKRKESESQRKYD